MSALQVFDDDGHRAVVLVTGPHLEKLEPGGEAAVGGGRAHPPGQLEGHIGGELIGVGLQDLHSAGARPTAAAGAVLPRPGVPLNPDHRRPAGHRPPKGAGDDLLFARSPDEQAHLSRMTGRP